MDTAHALGIGTALGPATTATVQILGQGGVPTSGVSAVSLNVVVSSATSASSYLEMWPDGTTKPSPGSVINFHSGETSSNSAVIAVGTDGKIDVYNSDGSAAVVVNVTGYFTSSPSGVAPGGYTPVTQARVVDTRNGTGVAGGQLAPGATMNVRISDVDGIANPSAVFANVTVPSPGAAGSLYAYADGGSSGQPVLAYSGEATAASAATIAVGADGDIAIKNGSSTQPVDVVVDLYGYFTPSVTQGGGFTPVQARLLDTRTTTTPVPAHGTTTVTVGGTNGIPTYGIGGAIVNITTTDQQNSGYLVGWPTGQPMPATSLDNFQAGTSRADMAILQPGTGGKISIANQSAGTIDVVVDLEGWFSSVEPSLPVDLVTAATDSTTPVLSGIVYGPTGDSVTGEIFLQDSTGTPVGDTPTATGTVPSGERATYAIPDGLLTTGQTYHWYMMACYESLCSAPTSVQTFTVTSASDTATDTPPANAITITLSGSTLTTEDAVIDSTGCAASCPVDPVASVLKVGSDGTDEWATAIKADLSSIPTGATVYSADLTLTKSACLNVCSAQTVDIEQADADVTSQTTGTALMAQTDPSGPVDSATDPAATFDVTSLVDGWLSGVLPDNGMILEADDTSAATSGIAYATGPTSGPGLTITYTPPVVPNVPENVAALPGDGGALVSWSPPADEGYTGTEDGGITYTVSAVDPQGTIAHQVTTGSAYAVITGLTNGDTYTFSVAAVNAVGTGPAATGVSASPQAVPGGTTAYTQTVSQFLNAQDELEEDPNGSAAGILPKYSGSGEFADQLTVGATVDTATAALELANNETDTQDSTSLSDTLVVRPSGSPTAEVFTTADETFTTIDTSGGSTASTPGEAIDNDEFFFNAAGTPVMTGLVDADAVFDPVNAESNETASAPDDATDDPNDTTPEGILDLQDHFSLSPNSLAPVSGRSDGNPLVAAWAKKWYKGTYNRFGDDCTDFVSRALFYGGHFPKRFDRGADGETYMTSNDKYWFFRDYYGMRTWSHSWSIARDLYQFEKKQYASFVDPRHAHPGDIVFVDWQGSNSKSIDHAAVITSMHGTNPYVTQHSITRINEPIYKVPDHLSWQKGHPSMHVWAAQPSEQ
ncbi:Fibronectin type III domain-containing protein [Actinacidiphila yanglinensis]|uniref:Fibronectin type III domain-containing protein n=1 Tax=Actinacidiphila yanglinensis TaxID=310779 RepID=A0A1H6DLV5_9ACTN|nr:amidase domain-containing protein [Actinacidiphila yanglinensis]SEG85555.1 Fibronectin type III domain-containing protein [Actinacidiphila yanglinensis]